MLQPREAGIPALIIFLVVIPLFTYILLGRWSQPSRKKARISLLAQLAAEEAFQVEAMASADVLPVLSPSRTGLPECARCLAPATTRCSRCKLVRYCSGKCQIMHWRQGHRHECLQWNDNSFNICAGLPPKPFLNNTRSPYFCNGTSEPLHFNHHSDMDDPAIMTTDTSLDSNIGRKSLDKSAFSKLKMVKSNGDGITAGAFEQDYGHCEACAQAPSTNHFTELVSEDAPAGHELAGGSLTCLPNQIHMNQEIYGSPSCRSGLTQHSKSTDEGRKVLKQSGLPVMSSQLHMDKRVITECQNGTIISPEKVDTYEPGFPSNSTVRVSYPAERPSARESMMYRKPPYTLGNMASSSQKLAENGSREYPCQGVERNGDKENGSRIQEKKFSSNTSIKGRTMASKKTPKVLKRNLVGLISDNKKNKLCQMLFPYEDLVKFFQCEEWRISPRGLHNCGNSCYANAVLQCLTGTKPLMVYLLRRLHSQTCSVKEWCLMCELEQHVSLLREGGGPLSPSKILSNMRNIGCRMGGGNQEDAHEFLRLLVMSMQSVCLEELGGEKEVDPRLQETTLIQQIFGGCLQSKVECLRCHHESERYESIMDLILEIHGWVESLEDALTQFTAPEDLDGENKYRCGRCSAYVQARKQLSLQEVPNILTIVLKRFQTGKYGKINKCVTFHDMLDMIPFVTGTADKPPLYMLYAVVVHLDNLNASFAGHYISYVKDPGGTWFRIDDSEVQAVPPSQVMSEGAYMLFYLRSFPRPPQAYAERRLLPRPPVCSRSNTAKSQKPWKHVISNDAGDMSGEHLPQWLGARSWELSEATSSDCSLFTSSDDSSFTTESTRDSFSTVDHGDGAATVNAISSVFGGPFYAPEYAGGSGSGVLCAKLSPARPQARFSPAGSADGMRKGRSLDAARAAAASSSAEPPAPAAGLHHGLHGQWK